MYLCMPLRGPNDSTALFRGQRGEAPSLRPPLRIVVIMHSFYCTIKPKKEMYLEINDRTKLIKLIYFNNSYNLALFPFC